MTTWHTRLADLNACHVARDWCRDYPDTREGFRAAWEECPDARWMLWLAFCVLPRRRAVGVLVEVVRATCAHLATDEVTTEVLNPLAAWSAGDESVNVEKVRARVREIWGAADTAAWAAAADDVATAAAWAAAAAAAYAAYAAWAADAATPAACARAAVARAAAADAAAATAAAAAQTHVVLAYLGADEVYDAMMGGGV